MDSKTARQNSTTISEIVLRDNRKINSTYYSLNYAQKIFTECYIQSDTGRLPISVELIHNTIYTDANFTCT